MDRTYDVPSRADIAKVVEIITNGASADLVVVAALVTLRWRRVA